MLASAILLVSRLHLRKQRTIRVETVGLNATNAVNRAHNQLIEVTADQQVRLLTQKNLHNAPDDLRDVFVNANLRTQVLDARSCIAKDSVEERLVRLRHFVLVFVLANVVHERLEVIFSVSVFRLQQHLHGFDDGGVLGPTEVCHDLHVKVKKVVS